MPWCDDCSKFWNPNSMPPDGACPTCGALIGEPPDTRVPWHFWVLIASVVAYLGWRLVQGVQWLFAHEQPVFGVLAIVVTVAVLGGAAAWNWWPEKDGGDTGTEAGHGTGAGDTA